MHGRTVSLSQAFWCLFFAIGIFAGLLIKEILRRASAGGQYSGMLEQTVGVLFYSVPHRGASLAKISKKAKYMVFPTIEVQELDCENSELQDLHRSFLDLMVKHHVPVLSIGEAEKTAVGLSLKFHLVPPESADAGIGEFHVVKSNHINVCKPRDRTSELYTLTLRFIRKCILLGKLKEAFRLKDS